MLDWGAAMISFLLQPMERTRASGVREREGCRSHSPSRFLVPVRCQFLAEWYGITWNSGAPKPLIPWLSTAPG